MKLKGHQIIGSAEEILKVITINGRGGNIGHVT